MRLSTILVVLAVFAIGGHAYASLFSIPAHINSPAAWPTFVDAGRLISSVAEPLARTDRLVDRTIPAIPVPSLRSSGVIAAVSTTMPSADARSGAGRKTAARQVPPLPVHSPILVVLKPDLRPDYAKPAILNARAVHQPATAARNRVTVTAAAKARIVTGSIERIPRPSLAVATPSHARRSAPPFDVTTRSSLGGPKVPPVKVAALTQEKHPADTVVMPDASSKPALRIPLVRAPRKLVKGKVPQVGAPASATAAVAATIKDGARESAPPRELQVVASPKSPNSDRPDLRPLGQSLAMVRIEPPGMRPHRGSRPASRSIDGTIRIAALGNVDLRTPLPTAERRIPRTSRAQAGLDLAAVSKRKARARKSAAMRSVRSRKTRRRQVAARRGAPRRVARSQRRVARAHQPRRRSARRAYHHASGTLWGRQAASSSMF